MFLALRSASPHPLRRLALACAAFSLAGLVGCGEGGGGFELRRPPRLEVDPAGGLIFEATGDGTHTRSLRLSNGGDAPLTVMAPQLAYEPLSAEEEADGPALSLTEEDGAVWPAILAPRGATPAIGERAELTITVRYRDPGDGRRRAGLLRVVSDDPDRPRVAVPIEATAGVGRLAAEPPSLRYDRVAQGASAEHTVALLNTGDGALTLRGVTLEGDAGFSATVEGEPVDADATWRPPGDGAVAPGGRVVVTVGFTPRDDQPAFGSLVIDADDPAVAAGLTIPLEANVAVPCLRAEPATGLDFGARQVGTAAEAPLQLRSCGAREGIVSSWRLEGPGSAAFTLTGPTPPARVTLVDPVVWTVTYRPERAHADGETGDDAEVVLRHDGFVDPLRIPLLGRGVERACPVAHASVREGPTVAPQTTLHLRGDASFAPGATIAAYRWSVQQPDGSRSVFSPSATWPNPTFEANVAGTYVFGLDVVDSAGARACETATVRVTVVPDRALHVELLWETPADSDPDDEGPDAGSDLDLHFLHPNAAGQDIDGDGSPDGWFDDRWDCAWSNPRPDWGSLDPDVDDDPTLDRDDDDGAGPENLNLEHAEAVTYRIGVHYFDDHGFGAARPRLRVFRAANEVMKLTGPWLEPGDLWHAATIDGAGTGATPLLDPDGAPVVSRDVASPQGR